MADEGALACVRSQVIVKLVGTWKQAMAAAFVFALEHTEEVALLLIFDKLVDNVVGADGHLILVFGLGRIEVVARYYYHFPFFLNNGMCIDHLLAKIGRELIFDGLSV